VRGLAQRLSLPVPGRVVEPEADRVGAAGRNPTVLSEIGSVRPCLAVPTRLRLRLSHTPPQGEGEGRRACDQSSSILSAAMKASCGISTLPNWRIRFLPAFCFSSSFFFRVASPP
jgi:hypothetical protein